VLLGRTVRGDARGKSGPVVNILPPMAERMVWVQEQTHQTDAGEMRVWHLAETSDQTLCGMVTGSMKALPKAEWGQVMNPCRGCQEHANLTEADRGLVS
jgi:hypothetical protein